MEELIKEAESLYLELSRITDSLVYARLHDDNDLLHGCRNELENYAQSVMQTFKCLVDRKDNIVDLGEVWHDITGEPLVGNTIVYVTKLNKIGTLKRVDNHRFSWYIEKYAICKWTYLKDLLPKGGN